MSNYRARAIELYFSDGHYCAEFFDRFVSDLRPGQDGQLSVMEFASGYGCVSRHWKNLGSKYRVVACDIHQAAVEFITHRLGMDAMLSHRDPDALAVPQKFDIVFALSFFSHIPDPAWGRWLRKLFDLLVDGGLLIFTTHGRVGWKKVRNPEFEDDGYWFVPLSEQKDLPVEDYGGMVVTPSYVMNSLKGRPTAHPMFFREAFWWNYQDTYVVQKGPEAFVYKPPPPKAPKQDDRELINTLALERNKASRLEAEILALRASKSWRVTKPLRVLYRRIPRWGR